MSLRDGAAGGAGKQWRDVGYVSRRPRLQRRLPADQLVHIRHVTVPEARAEREFADLNRDHPDVVFVTIANDATPEITRGWTQRQGYDFPVLIEGREREGGRPSMVADRAEVSAYPTTRVPRERT